MMDMHDINTVKAIVQAMLSQKGVTRFGLVTSVEPLIPAARVTLQPDGMETGYLPITCHAAATRMSAIALPSPGDQVKVDCDNGDAEHGIISGAAHGGATVPPVSPATGMVPQPGEWFVGNSTACVHVVGQTVYIVGNLDVTGTISSSGNTTSGTGASGSFTTPTGNIVTVRDGLITNIY